MKTFLAAASTLVMLKEQTYAPPSMTVSAGRAYLYADLGAGLPSNLNGWYCKLSVPSARALLLLQTSPTTWSRLQGFH